MVSYRTLIFGSIAVIAATAPALAAGPKAQPAQITYAGPKAQPSQTEAGPKAQPSQTDAGPKAQPSAGVITLLLKGLGDWESRILQIHL